MVFCARGCSAHWCKLVPKTTRRHPEMSVQSGSPADKGVRVVAMFNFEAKEAEPFPPDPHGVESSYEHLPQHAHTSPHVLESRSCRHHTAAHNGNVHCGLQIDASDIKLCFRGGGCFCRRHVRVSRRALDCGPDQEPIRLVLFLYRF